MNILILGGAGYIGSVLAEHLRACGDTVIIFDNLLYESRERDFSPHEFIKGDIRSVNDLFPVISRVDAVVNLAALSNDPTADFQPQLTWEINYKANELVSELCQALTKRVVYASTCSVYGFSEDDTFTEESVLGPVTLYGQTKMLSEKYYLQRGIDAVVLRFATVYGYSPKPRFDLVVNTMIGHGYFSKRFEINGGAQWRPLVHVKDVAKAIHLVLHARTFTSRIFNVGSNKQNYRIADLGDSIARLMPGVTVVHKPDSVDTRSYRVDFDRIQRELGFLTEYAVADAVGELREAFASGRITSLQDDEYFRIKYLKRNYTVREYYPYTSLLSLRHGHVS